MGGSELGLDGVSSVLIVGASGFIGQHLARYLCDEGSDVSTLSRRRVSSFSALALKEHYDPQFLFNIDRFEALIAAHDAVINLVGRAHQLRERADSESLYQETNVDFAGALYELCDARRIGQFIQLSSVGIFGSASVRPYGHLEKPQPAEVYSLTKLEAEETLTRLSEASATALTIVRPPLVYGPGARGNFARLERLVGVGIPLPLASIRNRRDWVSIYNLCDFIGCCLMNPRAQGGVFVVSDGQAISTPEVIRLIAKGKRKKARLIAVPYRVLWLMARSIGRESALEKLCGNFEIDISHTREVLGWDPPFTVEESFSKMYDEVGVG